MKMKIMFYLECLTINNFFYQLSNIIWWCESVHILRWLNIRSQIQGRIQDFKLRGGALKKNCAERREARKFLGYFLWKITILRQKIKFFPILGGARAGCAPPGSAPEIQYQNAAVLNKIQIQIYVCHIVNIILWLLDSDIYWFSTIL
jgi:hypothetical protein